LILTVFTIFPHPNGRGGQQSPATHLQLWAL
jgi:hypothetical protein